MTQALQKQHVQSDVEHIKALADVFLLVVTLLLITGVIYWVPSLEKYRPWSFRAVGCLSSEDGSKTADARVEDSMCSFPLAALFQDYDEPLPAYAGGSYRYGRTRKKEVVSLPPARPKVKRDGFLDEGKAIVQIQSRLEKVVPAQRIEDEDHRGLKVFFDALIELERGKRQMVRASHYGDSSIATDEITSQMRRRMQAKFGDGGHGFVLIAKGRMPYRHQDIRHRANDSWVLRQVTRGSLGESHYGYGGVRYQASHASQAVFETTKEGFGSKASQFLLYYQGDPRYGKARVRVDDGPWQYFSTKADGLSDQVRAFSLGSEGPHRVELRHGKDGKFYAYGAALETDGPGFVYDSLGLVGARASRLLYFEREHIRNVLAQRETQLLVLGFGGNEASDRVSYESYRATYDKVIKRMYQNPDKNGCLIMAPLDQAKKSETGHVRTMDAIPTIVRAQQDAAKAAGCAFYNTFEAMGGEGAMHRWSKKGLAMHDYRHATPKGYDLIAEMFYDALVHEMRAYLEQKQALLKTKDKSKTQQ